MADLVLAAKDGYGISNSAVGNEFISQPDLQSNVGYHGYLASNPKMNATFIVAGPGIKRGAKIGLVENVDVAPTIARSAEQRRAIEVLPHDAALDVIALQPRAHPKAALVGAARGSAVLQFDDRSWYLVLKFNIHAAAGGGRAEFQREARHHQQGSSYHQPIP